MIIRVRSPSGTKRIECEADTPVLVDYTQRLVDVAQREGLELVNLRRHFLQREYDDPEGFDLMLDIVHPSPAGHRLFAELLAERILATPEGPAGGSPGDSHGDSPEDS